MFTNHEYFIIIMSRCQHRSPWHSLTTRLYRPSLPGSLQGYILNRHRTAVTFARPYKGVHRSTSLMSSSLFLQQCPAFLVRLTWIVFMMGGRWLNSLCFVGCCLQDSFSTARSILVYLLSSFFSIRLVIVHVVHPYNSIDMTPAWKKLRFILSVRSDFHITDSLLIAVYAFSNRVLISFLVDDRLLPR